MARPHFYCLGTLCLDRIVEVDRLPGADDKAFIKAKHEQPGGPPRNVAAALAGWGEAVSFGSAIGDDNVGQSLLARLNDAGIGTESIEIVPDLETATTIIIVEASGERAVLVDAVAEPVLAVIGRTLRPLRNDAVIANLFHHKAVADVLSRARAHGALAVLDLEWPEIDRWGWDAALQAAAAADIVATNSQVVRAFADEQGRPFDDHAAQAMAEHLKPAGGKVCVTLGAGGVLARDGATLLRLAALPVTPRDTTGAGDRFLAGMTKAMMDGNRFEAALRRAVAGAGLFLAGGGDDWAGVELASKEISVTRLEIGAVS